jgi:hypothetical protein
VTISIVGRGRVGTGAKAMLDQLGIIEWVSPADLKAIASDTSAFNVKAFGTSDLFDVDASACVDFNPRKVYASQLSLSDYVEARHGKTFDRAEYEAHPERFVSRFGRTVCRSFFLPRL